MGWPVKLTLIVMAALAASGESAWAGSRQAGAATRPTAVIPPPVLPGRKLGDQAAGERWCDQLAEALVQTSQVQVVSRGQLDKVLTERGLADRPAGPLISFDVIVRVELDSRPDNPVFRVSVVDINAGVIRQAGGVSWNDAQDAKPPPPDAKTVQACVQAAQAAAVEKRFRVRIIGVTGYQNNPRLKPLADRLTPRITQRLASQPEIVLVQHFEAASLIEESLLLTAGMSRLSGGRQFMPQANASPEFRLREADGIGKAFEQTIIDIQYRLAGGPEDPWVSVKTPVKQWDQAVDSLGEKIIAAMVRRAAPTTVPDRLLADLVERHRQAEAELGPFDAKLARLLDKGKQLLPADYTEGLAHAAAAAKLDPTWEHAFYALIEWHSCARQPSREALPLVLDYLTRFKNDREHRHLVADGMAYAARFNHDDWTTNDFRMFRRIVDIADDAVTFDLQYDWAFWDDSVALTYDTLLAAGDPPAELRRWRDSTLDKGDAHYQKNYLRDPEVCNIGKWMDLRRRIIRYAIDEGDKPRARAFILKTVEQLPVGKTYARANITIRINYDDLAEQLGDSEVIKAVRTWKAKPPTIRLTRPPVATQPSHWTSPPSHPLDPPWLGCQPPASPIPAGALVKPIVVAGTEALQPVGIMGDRLYAVLFPRLSIRASAASDTEIPFQVGWVPLKAATQPALAKLTGNVASSLRLGPRPEVWFTPKCIAFGAGRLLIGTESWGVALYDPATNKWTTHGGEQGLPMERVESLTVLDDRLVLVAGESGKAIRCTLDLRTSETVVQSNRLGDVSILGAWKNGSRWLGLVTGGVYDNVLTGQQRYLQLDPPPGWSPSEASCPVDDIQSNPWSMVTLDGRPYIRTNDRLVELAADGRVNRCWSMGIIFRAGPPAPSHRWATSVPERFGLPLYQPGEMPAAKLVLFAASGKYLVFRAPDSGVVCLDPATDTWYGPVRVEGGLPGPGIGVAEGIWSKSSAADGQHTLISYLATQDIIDAATKTGQVATTAQLRKRRDAFIDNCTGLQKAWLLLALRQFEPAKRILAEALTRQGDDPMALLLMGHVHGRFALNAPGVAIGYYRRLEVLKDQPQAALTGLYYRWLAHIEAEQWPEAVEAATQLLAAKGLYGNIHDEVEYIRSKCSAKLRAAPQ